MIVKKNFVDSMVRIILDKKCKANVNFLLCDKIYPFIYDVKTTESGQFPEPIMFYIDNFQVCTSITMEMQLPA